MVGQYWPVALALAGWLVGTYEAVEQVSYVQFLFTLGN